MFPGILLPGLGHLALGERKAALSFFAADGAALALLFSGLAAQTLSGGSDRVAPAYQININAGMAMLTTLWLADIAGSARGAASWTAADTADHRLALSLGWTGLLGSRLEVGHGLQGYAAWRSGRFEVAPRLIATPSYLGLEGQASFALWRSDDRSNRFAVALGGCFQRFADEGFGAAGGELLADLRLGLGVLGPTLRDAWAITRIGIGLDAFHYDARSAALEDATPRLLLEMGAGVQATRRLQAELLYRYRKDRLPGGAIIPGLFDSFLGFLELDLRFALSEKWALVSGARIGNGVMPWLAVEAQL
ncbi:MAG: hypothetical protein ACOX6T_10060 [Myxococcales bacterium]